MATPKLYIETSVVSYLTAQGSRDLILVAHQQVTRAWWASRGGFDVYASQFVLDEASAGDAEAAARRLQALEGVPLLDVTMLRRLRSMGWTTCSAGTASTSRTRCCAAELNQSVGRQALSHLLSARHSNSLRNEHANAGCHHRRTTRGSRGHCQGE